MEVAMVDDVFSYIGVYFGNPLWPLHFVLLAVLIASFAADIRIMFVNSALSERLKTNLFLVETETDRLSSRYQLLAELFLLVGLAGAALVTRNVCR
jgi:hypothetical protein